MTPPASPRLPEAVEQTLFEYGEAVAGETEAVLQLPTKVDLCAHLRRHAETELRAAILAYGAARERQGIERAVAEADRIAGCYAAQREATLDEDFLTRYWAAHAVAECVRALPVDGATP